MRGGPPMRGGRGWGGGPRGFAPQVHTVFSIKGLFIIQSMNKRGGGPQNVLLSGKFKQWLNIT